MPKRIDQTAVSIFIFATLLASVGALADSTDAASRPAGLDPSRLAGIRWVRDIAISPDGGLIAYVLSVPRRPGKDEDGRPWAELHVVPTGGGTVRSYIAGEVNVSAIRFTPDGRFISYLAKRDDDENTSLWAIPVDGGESRRLMAHDETISSYRISPDGTRVAFIAPEPESDDRENAREKGYKQEIFEEDWLPRRVWLADLRTEPPAVSDPAVETDDDDSPDEPVALDVEGSAFDLEWMPGGDALALTLAPTPLIDDRYMARRIHIVDVETGRTQQRIDNPGKLGRYAVSPDGRRLALISAADRHDPREGRLLIADLDGDELELRDSWPGFDGHVRDLAWKDDRTVVAIADRGVETLLAEIDVIDGSQSDLLSSGSSPGTPVLSRLVLGDDGRAVGLIGETPAHPREVFSLVAGANGARRLTDSNPWLSNVALARQEVVSWKAQDGLELEGILLHPLEPDPSGGPSPLLLMVHGGPEGHDRNGWVTSYSRPGQIASARGYAVLYPNYRGSTGRGVAFSKLGQSDAAGKEFDDLVDAVDAMVERGIADGRRVGINGGSYGGYATAWCATRHTERFRAGVMFVGISNKISKGLTTEIPVEDRSVHTRFDPWTRWQVSLERSPIYYAEQSRTALLIAGGTDDTRVHPSQSLQLYRALKLIGKTPVRYVRYPGERHGNAKAAARDDYSRRLLRWMDHFVAQGKTDLPPWELEVPALAGEDEENEED